MEFHLFLPQMRLTMPQLVERAWAAEAAGFAGIAGMDHLAPPLAETQPMYEAMVTSTWLAAETERLTIGSLVLCDGFRHPAVLAREAVSLDHASGGRFELGIGWGSVQRDFDAFGIGPGEPRVRARRLRETLDVLRALWTGEVVDHDGEFYQLRQACQQPTPLTRIPIVIGGSGPTALALAAEHADWWNLHVGLLDRLEELRPQVGAARVSIQQMVALVPSEAERASVTETAQRRFGGSNPVIGTAPELVDYFSAMAERGVERVYAWFCDFAPPDTLRAFGQEVIVRVDSAT
jgi:alkanesulfonate monooxygenase SsuD/methylene tetrahydromethanopterin reductase-like flavin-dependent oxidoreductase (luciferase family)